MNSKALATFLLGVLVLAGCGSRATPAPPTAIPTLANTPVPFPLTLTPAAVTPLPGETVISPASMSATCSDPQVMALIESFKTAVRTADGALLSSLVSPTRGMDVAYLRDGTVITYDQQHAKFLFETTYEVDWGVMPGSGLAKQGSFHDVIVPELVKAFDQPYTLYCNELKHGGATYELEWPYKGDFYSLHFPGTEANGNMDWHTWVIGVEYANSQPYIYALMQFFWEP